MLVRESDWLGSGTRGLHGWAFSSGRVERVLYDLSKLRGESVSHTAKCTPHFRLKKAKSPHTTPQSAGSTLPTPGGAQRIWVPWRASHPKKKDLLVFRLIAEMEILTFYVLNLIYLIRLIF